MSHSRQFNIDLSEQFPHLSHAPVVEAVIHWQARAEKKLDRDALLQHLKDQLPDYPHARPQYEVRFEGQCGPDAIPQKSPSHLNSWDSAPQSWDFE